MNYRHIYHAGNFADIFKHIILIKLLKHFQQKESGFGYLDTHSGIGLYSLESDQAQKTAEFTGGIDLLKQMTGLFPEAEHLLNICNQLPAQHYPGSPLIAGQFLRPQDTGICCELHPDDAATLKHNLRRYSALHIHQRDGYQSLKAFLPFQQRRGLILIDPPFEQKSEFETIFRAVTLNHQHFRQGTFAVWYPIKSWTAIETFHHQWLSSPIRKILAIDLTLYNDTQPDRLNGCGMLIINPPYQFDEWTHTDLIKLHKILAVDGGQLTCKWIVPE